MNADAQLILDSLEVIAETHEDLVPLVYERFYARFPETRQMFGRDENNVHQGHMFNGMLIAVIEHSEGRCYPGSIDAWVTDHDLWGVKQRMFHAMFDALFETIQNCMGAGWTPAVEQAWRLNVYGLSARFDAACASKGLCEATSTLAS